MLSKMLIWVVPTSLRWHSKTCPFSVINRVEGFGDVGKLSLGLVQTLLQLLHLRLHRVEVVQGSLVSALQLSVKIDQVLVSENIDIIVEEIKNLPFRLVS